MTWRGGVWVGAENRDIDPNAWVDVNIDMDTGRFTFQVPFPERYTANLVWKTTITRYKPSPQWNGCKMFVNSVGPVFCVFRIGFSTDTPVLMDVFVRIMEPASWLSRIPVHFIRFLARFRLSFGKTCQRLQKWKSFRKFSIWCHAKLGSETKTTSHPSPSLFIKLILVWHKVKRASTKT